MTRLLVGRKLRSRTLGDSPFLVGANVADLGSGTSFEAQYPASTRAGDLVSAIWFFAGNAGGNNSIPSGWIYVGSFGAASSPILQARHLVGIAGSESSATLQVSSSVDCVAVVASMRDARGMWRRTASGSGNVEVPGSITGGTDNHGGVLAPTGKKVVVATIVRTGPVTGYPDATPDNQQTLTHANGNPTVGVASGPVHESSLRIGAGSWTVGSGASGQVVTVFA